MVRLIKRYESRKLYDTEESRYVSLEEIATWVRGDQEVRVIDNATSDDVTTQTLTQVILEEGRNGSSALPAELLHELVRSGARAFSSGVEHVQQGVDRFVQNSMDKLTPVREAREEMSSLRDRLEDLETSLQRLEVGGAPVPRKSAKAARKPRAKKPAAARKTAKKTARRPAKKTTK